MSANPRIHSGAAHQEAVGTLEWPVRRRGSTVAFASADITWKRDLIVVSRMCGVLATPAPMEHKALRLFRSPAWPPFENYATLEWRVFLTFHTRWNML